MKLLFLDESGDHNLSVIDAQYPLFVLGGVIVEQAYAESELSDALDQFKQKVFGTTDIILHTADIARNRNGFEGLRDREFRQYFYQEINSLMRRLDYSAIACVIQKSDHLSRYGLAALDPYLLSLDIVVEQFCFDIGEAEGGGIIIAERRDPTLDRELELAWLNLKIQGTGSVQAKVVESRIDALNLRRKSDNIAGLQLADLVVSPIGRMILGKRAKEDWHIVKTKLRRGRDGNIEGHGLIVLPK